MLYDHCRSSATELFIDGHEEVFKMAEEIQGCPIVGPWGPRN